MLAFFFKIHNIYTKHVCLGHTLNMSFFSSFYMFFLFLLFLIKLAVILFDFGTIIITVIAANSVTTVSDYHYGMLVTFTKGIHQTVLSLP